jgi:RimJ/RimL family protein N-acetyltransferase
VSAAAIHPRTIKAEGLLLRPHQESDEAAVAIALEDPDILRWAAGTAVVTAPKDHRAARWLQSRIIGWASGMAFFAVVDQEGELLGSVGIRDVNRLPGQAVVSYWVAPCARGRGIAPRALDAAAGWAFAGREEGGLGLHRLYLDHALVNVGSCRVAVKAGFALEGTMRGFFVDPGGERHDSHLHARLATD